MKLLLLLFIAVSANAATLTSRQCNLGPSYWCGSILQAEECGAVQYCTDNDWANIKTTEGEFCTDCKLGISALREALTKASTEDEIVKAIEGFCSNLGALAEDCKLVVEAYGATVLKALIDELEPDQICALMGFCKQETFVNMHKEDLSLRVASLLMTQAGSKLMDLARNQLFVSNDNCGDCTAFIGDVKNKLNDPAVEQAITDELKSLCQYLGEYQSECELLVTTLVPQGIGQLIQKIVPKQICTEIGFCPATFSIDEPIPEPSPNDPCSDCKAFMGDVKTILNNATIQKMLIQELESLCNDLGSLAPQCQQLVEQYGGLAITLLVGQFDPDSVCGLIQFCPAVHAPMVDASPAGCSGCKIAVQAFTSFIGNPEMQKKIISEVSLVCSLMGPDSSQCKEMINQYGPLVFTLIIQVMDHPSFCSKIGFCAVLNEPEALAEPGDICTDCQTFVNDFDALLNNYTVQQEFLQELTFVCKYLPNYSDECKTYLLQYGGLVFEVIAGFINPRTVCTDIGLCTGEGQQQFKLPKILFNTIRNAAPNDTCNECKAIFVDIQKLLSDPDVQKMLVSDLELLCNDLGPFGPTCKQYVDEYGDMVFNFLIQYIDPDALCSTAGLCSSGISQSVPPSTGADQCTDCKNFFQDVFAVANSPAIQKEILAEVSTLCSDLGTSLGPQCQALVSEYGPLAINFLLQYLDPATVCGEIGFCSSGLAQRPLVFMALKTVLRTPTVSSDLCSDCKALVNDADGLLRNATAQQMFLKDLSGLCKYFGGLNTECKELITEYGPLVFEYIAEYIDPTTVCEDIGLCPAVVTLNADQCSDCKNFLQDVSTMLNTPSVQQAIVKGLTTLCNDLGPKIGPQCTQYVSEYGPFIITYLLQYLDPTALCGDIGFCPTAPEAPLFTIRQNADQCSDCKAFFGDVANILNNETVKNEIITAISQLCNDLGPSIGPQCQQYVQSYGPLVFTLLLQYLDPAAICGDIGFCAAVQRPPMTLIDVNADQCSDCKAFFGDVADILKNQTVQKEILSEISQLCNDLGPSMAPQCQQYVQMYGPIVFNLLLQYVNPPAICGEIGFCPAVERPPMTLLKTNADQCSDCKAFFGDVADILKNQTVQKEIFGEISQLCNDLGPSMAPQCQQYVQMYGPIVFNLLLQYVNPPAICGEIGFCPAVERPPMTLLKTESDLCAECLALLGDIVDMLKNETIRKEILAGIHTACDSFDPSTAALCHQYVDQYGPIVFDQLAEWFNPEESCEGGGFCPSLQGPQMTRIKVNTDQCSDCKAFIGDAVNILKNDTVQQEIIQEIEQLCNNLGPSIGPQCQQYVGQYAPLVFSLLTPYLDPVAICGDIGFCPAIARSPNADQCTDCKAFFGDIVDTLKDPAVQDQIVKELVQLCSDLGPTMAPECQLYVQQYAPMVINLLLQYMDPGTICGDIGFCPAVERPMMTSFSVDPEECTHCLNFVEDVTELLRNTTYQQCLIQWEEETTCWIFGPVIAPQCKIFFETLGPIFFDLVLSQANASATCANMGLCSPGQGPPLTATANRDICIDCELWAKDMFNKMNDTVPALLEEMEGLCDRLVGPSLSTLCKQLVRQYGPSYFHLIFDYETPVMFCEQYGFCHSVQRPPLSLVNVTPAIFFAQYGFCPSVQRPPLSLVNVNRDICTDCKLYAKDMLKVVNNSVPAILEEFEGLCDSTGPSLSALCKQLVSQYGPDGIDIILHYETPVMFCEQYGFCPSVQRPPRSLVNVNADDCTDCKTFFGDVINMLKDPKIQQDIIQQIEQLCNDLGPSIAPQCKQYVDQYGPMAFDILLQYLDPAAICGDIGFCPAVQRPPLILLHWGADQCTDCTNFFRDVVEMINSPSTQKEILQEVGKLCSVLGPSFGPTCQAYVNEYGSLVIDKLLGYLDPSAICGDIGFCSTTLRQKNFLTLNADQCTDCTNFFKDVLSTLNHESTQQMIIQGLESLCDDLGSDFGPQCRQYVAEYGPLALNILINYLDPPSVCKDIGFCSSLSVVPVSELTNALPVSPLKELPKASGEACELCELVVKQIDIYLERNATEEEIIAAVEKLCSILPASLASQCDAFIEQYGEVLIQLLINEADPDTVCSLLGLCSSSKQDLTASTSCTFCEYGMTELEKLITKDSTVAEIQAALTQVCDLLPSTLTQQCESFVTTYTSTIVNLIVQNVPPHLICRAIGLCKQNLATPPVSETGPECAICEYVMEKLDSLISEDSTQAEIEAALDKVCGLLPSTVTEECDELIKEYTPEIIQLLLAKVSPKVVCSALGLCTSKIDTTETGPKCSICESVMKKLEGLLSENSTEAEIEAALAKVCGLLPSSVTEECDELVRQYTPTIIQLLLAKVTPQLVCSALGLCTTELETTETGPKCVICEFVMEKLDGLLSENSTEAEIEAALDEVCNLLPSTVRAECDELVNQYTPVIIQLLLAEISPKRICTALGLCTSKLETKDVELGPQCMLCKYLFNELAKILDDDATVSEIESALKQVCSLLPSKESRKCQQFVDKYTERIIDLLTNSVPPRLICMALGLCVLEDKPVQETGPECAFCEYVMEKLDGLITKDSTQAEIEAALEEVCSLLPSAVQDECDELVQAYTPEIIQLLLAEVSPKLICSKLGLCSGKTVDANVELGPQCMLCKYLFNELAELLDKDSTVSEIESALKEVCSLFPSKESRKCQQFVDKYTERIIDLLTNSVPPRLICMALGLCVLEDEPVQEVYASPQCMICEYVMTELDKLLVKDGTISDIQSALDKVCTLLPGTLTSQCQSFVATYTETLVNLLVQSVPPKLICRALTLCKTGMSATQEPEATKGQYCAICEMAMTQFEKMLVQPGTEAQIEQALSFVCGQLPATVSKTCKSFVDQYTREIIFLITQSVSPKQVCTLLTLCTAQPAVESVPDQPMNSQPANPPVIPDKTAVGASTECVVCEFAMGEVEKQLGKNATEEEIKKALNNVCGLLPESIREDCNILIKYYTTEVIYQFLRNYPPGKICQLLRVCTTANSELKGVISVPVEAGPGCAICEFLAKKLEDLLQEDSSEAEIRAALKKICSLLPSTVTDDCAEFVDYYTEEIIFILVSQLHPDKLCSALQVCTATSVHDAEPVMSTVDVPVTCEICIIAIRSAELYITKNTTEAEIEKALNQLCKTFPAGLQDQCLSLVATFGNVLPELIVSLGDPDKICQAIDLCPKQLDMKQTAFDKCSSGPEFWCASQTNADLCNAVEHCKRHVWN